MKNYIKLLSVVLVIISSYVILTKAQVATGGTYTLDQSVIAGGGGQSSAGGTFSLDGTVGQAAAGGLIGGSGFSLTSGFWNFAAALGGQGREADVADRFTGDGTYQANDPSLIEEFLIFAKSPNPGFNEFQRADCAPYNTQGDGRLDITDVNLAEQYLITAVLPQTAAGPLQAIPPPANQQARSSDNGQLKSQKAALLPRVIKAGDVSTSVGQTITVPILIDAEGDETGYSFTLDYDPNILTNTGVTAGDVGGTRAVTIGDFPNNLVAKGKTTFSLRNFPGAANTNPVPAGSGQVLVRVEFSVNAGATAGITLLTFSGNPTENSVTNASSQPLMASFTQGTVTISGATAAAVTISGRVVVPDNRGLRNARVKLTDGRGEARTAITTAFGYFRFTDVQAGATYVLTVESKRYVFESQVLNVNGELTELIFNAVGQNPFVKKIK